MTADSSSTPPDGSARGADAASGPDAPPATAQPSSTSTSDSVAPRAGRVLTVGDGNFSFSLALVKQQKEANRNTAVAVTATSYDSYDELVAKYPESARICEQLTELLGARVLHRVDATNLRASLEQSEASASGNVGVFDRIMFNHPHCGEENVRRHQSLLSHFYVSALEILGVNGRVHLTLAEGQPERWEALARAERAGLKLCEQIDDVDSHPEYGLQYERKRHQNGKSFHQVTLHGEKKRQMSTLFIFARASDVDSVKSTGDALVSSSSPKAPSTAASAPKKPSRKRKAEDKPKQKKQKKPSLVETPTDLVCHECDKSFKSAQGLKTHVHMVHELQEAGPTAPEAAPLPCGYCDRTFKNEDAQRQHRVAKHGKDQLIKPDWYVTTEQSEAQHQPQEQSVSTPAIDQTGNASTTPQVTPKTCSICQLEFASQKEFDRHWTNLQPKQVEELLCPNCGRGFGEERALRQHQNFCSVDTSALAEDGDDAAMKDPVTA